MYSNETDPECCTLLLAEGWDIFMLTTSSGCEIIHTQFYRTNQPISS